VFRTLLLPVFLVACEADTLDAPAEPPAFESWTVDAESGPAGTELTATAAVRHFEFTGESDHGHDEAAEEDEEHGHDTDEGGVQRGHIHVYLDDLMTNPLLMQVTATATFTIPEEADVGDHTLMARLHDGDHLIIEPQQIIEVPFEVLESEPAE